MIQVGILGASGYTGFELVRLLRGHPDVHVVALGANSSAGRCLSDLYETASTWRKLPVLQKIQEIDFATLDVVFCALPHGASAEIVHNLMTETEVRLIIDLSNDHRLVNYEAYEGMKGSHPFPETASQAVYGLAEWHRDRIKTARLIANPGCYPTSVLLPILPLIKADLVDPERIIANAASGTSGAGRVARTTQLHSEVSENFQAYALGKHRHFLEIQEQIEATAALCPRRNIIFNSHLLPMNRGMLCTLTLDFRHGVEIDVVRNALEAQYASSPFIHIANPGTHITTKSVRGTNLCRMSLHTSHNDDQLLITCAIDNLIKGASGQAIQNMNLALGLDEGAGLINLSSLEP